MTVTEILEKTRWSHQARASQSLRSKTFYRSGYKDGTRRVIDADLFVILQAHPEFKNGQEEAKKDGFNPSKSHNPWRPDTLEWTAWNYGWNSSMPIDV
jgi:hypothetical protein